MTRVFAPFAGNKLQFGRETTPGTAVAAAYIHRGPFQMIEDDRTRNMAEEQTGTIVKGERSYDVKLGARLALPSTELTFQQFPHTLEGGIMTATPSGTDPYTRAYAFPVDGSTPTIKTYTWEGGNVEASADVQEMEYSFVEEFEISGAADAAWTISATWVGRQLTGSSFTGALALETVEEAVFGKAKLYIEDSEGNYMPTTQVSDALMGLTLRVRTGWQPVPGGDGNLYFRGLKWTMPEITGTITYELEQDTGVSRVATERGKYRSNAIRLLRINITGTGDNEIDIYMPIRYDRFGTYENSDGNTTVNCEFHAVYSPADAGFFNIDVTNNDATL